MVHRQCAAPRVVCTQQARVVLGTSAVGYSPLVTDDVPRTRLQPRSVRMVHKVRVAVEEGPDAGTVCAPDDGAALVIGTSGDNLLRGEAGDDTISAGAGSSRSDSAATRLPLISDISAR